MSDFMQRLRAYVLDALGARVTIAIAALALVAFLAHAITAPGRLPPFGTIGLAELGFIATPPAPPPLTLPDFLDAATQAELRQGLREAATTKASDGAYRARAYLAAHPDVVGALNWAGVLVALGLLSTSIAATARRERRSVR